MALLETFRTVGVLPSLSSDKESFPMRFATTIHEVVVNGLAIENQRKELLTRFPDRWVAIARGRVVADAESLQACGLLAYCLVPDAFVTFAYISLHPDKELPILDKDKKISDLPAPGWLLRFLLNESEWRSLSLVSVAEVREKLQKGGRHSVSFDLHGTLVLPRMGWNRRIYKAFEDVLAEAGCADILSKLEADLGAGGAVNFVAEVAKKYYRIFDSMLNLNIFFERPSVRWTYANNYAIGELIAGDIAKTDVLKARLGDSLALLGHKVHLLISGSDPDDWHTLPEQRELIQTALDLGFAVFVLSNGSQDSVTACVKRHFPDIPPWQVLTPEVLANYGKPSVMHATLFIFETGCAMVRSAIEGRPAPSSIRATLPKRTQDEHRQIWCEARRRSQTWLVQKLSQEPTQRFGDTLPLVAWALKDFCREMGLQCDVDNLVYADDVFLCSNLRRHLHVGNSPYHDAMPMLSGLTFDCLLYVPEDPSIW